MLNPWKYKSTWHLLQQGKDLRQTFENHSHLVQHWDDFARSSHMSIRQKASITQCKLSKKHLLNFMFVVLPNDKWFIHISEHWFVLHGCKFFALLIIKTFLFETLFFHKNFTPVSFFYWFFDNILQSEISCRNPVKYNV